uniref:Alpha-galactosidase n=1 Tax=Heterorhabditis bacteriophora TaxID=37862 RepID=A0A1I7XGK1_HETBA
MKEQSPDDCMRWGKLASSESGYHINSPKTALATNSADHFELWLGSSPARGVFIRLGTFGLPFILVDVELSSRAVLSRCG